MFFLISSPSPLCLQSSPSPGKMSGWVRGRAGTEDLRQTETACHNGTEVRGFLWSLSQTAPRLPGASPCTRPCRGEWDPRRHLLLSFWLPPRWRVAGGGDSGGAAGSLSCHPVGAPRTRSRPVSHARLRLCHRVDEWAPFAHLLARVLLPAGSWESYRHELLNPPCSLKDVIKKQQQQL